MKGLMVALALPFCTVLLLAGFAFVLMYSKHQEFETEYRDAAYETTVDSALRDYAQKQGWSELASVFVNRRPMDLEDRDCEMPAGHACRAIISTKYWRHATDCRWNDCTYLAVKPELWRNTRLRKIVINALRRLPRQKESSRLFLEVRNQLDLECKKTVINQNNVVDCGVPPTLPIQSQRIF